MNNPPQNLLAISDFDIFFFYGLNDLQTEIESDLMAGFLQPSRSLFYDRQDSAQIEENYPNGFSMSIQMKYNISNWISFRNTQVSDGTNGNPDRRVVVSQNYITFQRDTKGNLDVSIFYIPFYSFSKAKQITIPVIGGIS